MNNLFLALKLLLPFIEMLAVSFLQFLKNLIDVLSNLYMYLFPLEHPCELVTL